MFTGHSPLHGTSRRVSSLQEDLDGVKLLTSTDFQSLEKPHYSWQPRQQSVRDQCAYQHMGSNGRKQRARALISSLLNVNDFMVECNYHLQNKEANILNGNLVGFGDLNQL
jgi:hypothetical protein